MTENTNETQTIEEQTTTKKLGKFEIKINHKISDDGEFIEGFVIANNELREFLNNIVTISRDKTVFESNFIIGRAERYKIKTQFAGNIIGFIEEVAYCPFVDDGKMLLKFNSAQELNNFIIKFRRLNQAISLYREQSGTTTISFVPED